MPGPVTRLTLRVSPGAGGDQVVGRQGPAWKLRVRPAPEHGRANEAVLALLAGVLAVPRSRLRLVSGHASRNKIVELDGVDRADAELRLARANGDGERR